MNNFTIRDYKIINLQKEYVRYSTFLYNIQTHIDRCYTYFIINSTDRNNYLKIISDLLKQINTTYNSQMVSICETINSEDSTNSENIINIEDDILIDQNGTFDDIKHLVDIYNTFDIKNTETNKQLSNIFIDPFIDIKKNILNKLTSHIGIYSIFDGLNLIIGSQFAKYYNKDIMTTLNIYNSIFIPLKLSIQTESRKELIYLKNTTDNEVIVDDIVDLYIQKLDKDDTHIVFTGYFNTDPLGIIVRTSQICNNFIYQKKKVIEAYSNKQPINDKFIKMYIKNAPLNDIIILTEEEFFKKMELDYQLYNKLTRMSFMNLMKEFVKDDKNNKINLKHMFRIIKLLLLGNEESVNVAGLLFGISKERKPGHEFSIADIIYKSLNFSLQVKLKKSSINIKNELEKLKTISMEDIDLKKQIAICKNMPESVKKATLEKVEEMKSSNNEYYKQLLYVKTLLNYPWPSDNDNSLFIDIIKTNKNTRDFLDSVIIKLNEKVYGHDFCKNCIKELIGQWVSNPTSSGTAIGLVGPPGVGKTLIAKAIGDALDIPFVQITLGGQNDGDLLHGHGYTYSGAQPGMVVKKMVEAGSSRCIMYFDELDKACKKHDSNEIFNILIHLIDPNTNKEFQDRFFQEINFPLDKVLFIFSYNDSSLIDSILLDRIKEIKVKPFKLQDKKIIANKFLIKEMTKLVGFDNDSILITDDDIEFIIDHYTYEAGVRDLRRKLEQIFLKLNIDRIYKKDIFKDINNISSKNTITVPRELIKSYLGKESVQIQTIHTDDTVGVINGLFANDAGKGGVLPIQIYINYTGGDDKFTLKLTGNQRKVMRESVVSAFTTAVNIIRDDIRNDYIKNNPYGFHIHTPGGAIPKDGPSAGCAFTTAFISRILNKKIKHNIGMTGEIELTGKITKIGGLHYKLTGAKRAGITTVFVPLENSYDIETIKSDYKDLFDNDFKVVLVDNISEILEHALIDFDKHSIKI